MWHSVYCLVLFYKCIRSDIWCASSRNLHCFVPNQNFQFVLKCINQKSLLYIIMNKLSILLCLLLTFVQFFFLFKPKLRSSISPVRYVLKIHFFIEFGLKMIQFKIQFKTKSKIFIQKNIHSKQNPKYSFKKIFIQ